MTTLAQLLPLNQVEHFYRGGERIAAFRGGAGSTGMRSPEEWIASMTTMTSRAEDGLSRLADGVLLRDAVTANPLAWLGPDHLDRFGVSTELLVKLLDAGQRLPVHLHPDRAFSRAHLGLGHGKTEAWIILGVEEGARVRLGFNESLSAKQLRALVDAGDSAALVHGLHAREVAPGDAVLVPAGLPHCIDAGVFLLELQEPTDLSILLEAQDLPLDVATDGHLGLGFDVALEAVRRTALSPGELDALVLRADDLKPDEFDLVGLLPAAGERFFRAHRLRAVHASPSLSAGFAVVVVDGGAGTLVTQDGNRLDVSRGDAALVPFAAGEWRLEGQVEALVCRPPQP
jgi:mannose-6-phosphate isomerase